MRIFYLFTVFSVAAWVFPVAPPALGDDCAEPVSQKAMTECANKDYAKNDATLSLKNK